MKNKIFTIGLALMAAGANAQVADSVELGAGYVNESYYSLATGEVVNIPNNDWDLAFDASAYGATIRANRLVEVYVYPGDIAEWETVDTTGMEWNQYFNSDLTWSLGALNAPADVDEATDLGWGEYSPATHFTNGTKIFIVKLQSGDYKKLLIEQLASGAYTFQYDNLDNSDFTTDEIEKAPYSEMNFIHYSMETKAIVEREPNSEEWDLVFTNYLSEVAPEMYYGVTGVLSNVGVEVEEVTETPTEDAMYSGEFSTDINVIGHDWKTFNMGTFSYDIEEDLTYFVFTNAGDVWKLVFTGFNGSTDGKIFFTKELLSTAGVEEEIAVEFSVYPNPATEVLNLSANELINNVRVYAANGQQVLVSENNQTNLVQLNVNDLEKGMYIVETTTASGAVAVEKFFIAD